MTTGSNAFDYSPLTRRVGWGARLKALPSNNLHVIAGTVAVLLLVVPLIVPVALVASGNATDPGGLVVLAMVASAGAYTLVDLFRTSGGASRLVAFAQANELEALSGSTARHYAGRLFAAGSHGVHQAVRTRDRAFVEVGDRVPTSAPRSSRRPNRPELYLRARLVGWATRGPDDVDLVTTALHDALSRLTGGYAIEVSGDELTLFCSRALDAETPGRVEEAFALAEALAARADLACVPSEGAVDAALVEATSSGIPVPVLTRPEPTWGRPPAPLKVIAWTIAVMIVGPLAIAVVMSILDDGLRGDRAGAQVVVSLVVVAALAIVTRLVKAALAPRRAAERRNDTD